MSKGAAHTADLRNDLQHDRITVSLTDAVLTTPLIDGASLTGTTLTTPTITSPSITGGTISGADITASTIPSPKTSGGLYDTNGAALLDYGNKSVPVNNLRLTQGAAGEAVTLEAVGASAAIDLNLVTKSTGVVKFNGTAAPTTAALSAGTAALATPKITTSILDTNGNEFIKFTATASAVDEITITNAAANGTPSIAATGGDTDIDLNLVSKGTGVVQFNGVAAPTTATQATAIAANTAALYNQTAASSPLLSAVGTGFLLVADTAYWVYIGQMPRAGSVTGIQFVVTVAAIGTQAAEIAIGTTAAAPTHTGNADITVAADASVSIAGDLTATGYFDESSITYEFTAGAHIWIGIRANFTVGPTQPTLSGLVGDFGRGYVQRTATAGVLAELVYAGTVPTPTVTAAALVPSGPALTCEITFT